MKKLILLKILIIIYIIDDTFLDIFLLTYRAYINPMEFFQLLTARYPFIKY